MTLEEWFRKADNEGGIAYAVCDYGLDEEELNTGELTAEQIREFRWACRQLRLSVASIESFMPEDMEY